jgi:CheY-like chemotaxis protein
LRLLIADDDPVSQLVLTRQLEARGYAVDIASNGREAIDLYAGESYRAIFMDCQMPEVNGYDATAAIRAEEAEDERTPIIGMTASVRESDREQCFLSGMDDYVAKPLDQSTLDAALARRLPVLEERGARDRDDSPTLPILDSNSRLTDVFRHNEESRARIDQLAAAEALGDSTLMQRLSHALKGTAGAVGARALEQVCAAVQGAVTDGRTEDAVALQDQLEHCFTVTCDLLRKGCPGTRDRELALN